MAKRREFSRKTRREVFLRAGGRCEHCSAKLKVGEGEYDHVIPCEFGGDDTADNCQVLCRVCHKLKTAKDIGAIRKSDRVRDRHAGIIRPTHRWGYGKNDPLKKKVGGKVVRRDVW